MEVGHSLVVDQIDTNEYHHILVKRNMLKKIKNKLTKYLGVTFEKSGTFKQATRNLGHL